MLNVKSWRAGLTGGIEQVASSFCWPDAAVRLEASIFICPSPHFCRLDDGDEVVGLEMEFQILAVGSFGDFIFRLFAAKSPNLQVCCRLISMA